MTAADDTVYGRLCYNGYLVLHDLLYGLANSGCLPRAFCLAVPLELQLERTIAPNLMKRRPNSAHSTPTPRLYTLPSTNPLQQHCTGFSRLSKVLEHAPTCRGPKLVARHWSPGTDRSKSSSTPIDIEVGHSASAYCSIITFISCASFRFPP